MGAVRIAIAKVHIFFSTLQAEVDSEVVQWQRTRR